MPNARAFSSSGEDYQPILSRLRKLKIGRMQETQDRPPPKSKSKKKEQDADKEGCRRTSKRLLGGRVRGRAR